ncbi:MAG TPA: hypothetical protein VGF99_01615 [Myxococcota bacterium]
MRRRLGLSLVSSVLAAVLAVAVVDGRRAEACGPGFPESLLHDRQRTLTAPLDEPFLAQTTHLADGLVPAEPTAPAYVAVRFEDEGVRDRGGVEERRLYDDGARLFAANDVEGARVAFTSLLALPAEQRRERSTWAAFMLGRLGDVARFAEVRRLVDDGYVDGIGLAVGSLGEEARHHLTRADGEFLRNAHNDADLVDDSAALLLYARQARYGEDGGISLLNVARSIVDDGGPRLQTVAQTPIGQRLLALYGATRADERPEAVNAALDVLVAVGDGVAWPDQLAAALYKQGRIDEATRFAAITPTTPTALWVRARLAMKAGRLDEASALLAAAAKAFPEAPAMAPAVDDEDAWAWWYAEGTNPIAGRRRVHGEQGVLALARGEYVFALERFLAEDAFWRDAARVAERVLTVDELKQFVETHPPYAAPPAKNRRPDLRNVLARRLVRVGRLEEAATFTDDAKMKATVQRLHALRTDDDSLAAEFAELTSDVKKAARHYAEAQLLRTQGLELLGSELEPDWAIFGGWYEPWDEVDYDDDGNVVPKPTTAPLVSADEQRRAKESVVTPTQRYHYRALAVAAVERAADTLPPRTQAYAAVLCHGTHFANGHDDVVKRLWQRYVHNGAVVDFAGAFGATMSDCPAPDFVKASAYERAHRYGWLRRVTPFSLVALVAIAVTVLVLRRRRR